MSPLDEATCLETHFGEWSPRVSLLACPSADHRGMPAQPGAPAAFQKLSDNKLLQPQPWVVESQGADLRTPWERGVGSSAVTRPQEQDSVSRGPLAAEAAR